MDWTTPLLASLACACAYLLATRKVNPRWNDEQRERFRRWRWPGAAVVAILIFAFTAASWSAQRWLLLGLIALMIAYLARLLIRGGHDRTLRNALLMLTFVFVLFGGAAFLPGNAGFGVFAAGFVLLVLGGRVLRRQGKSQRL